MGSTVGRLAGAAPGPCGGRNRCSSQELRQGALPQALAVGVAQVPDIAVELGAQGFTRGQRQRQCVRARGCAQRRAGGCACIRTRAHAPER